MDPTKTVNPAGPEKPKTDLTRPIARAGEAIYASIQRERSGQTAGEIDMGVRSFAIAELSEHDQIAIVRTALNMADVIASNCSESAKAAARNKLIDLQETFS